MYDNKPATGRFYAVSPEDDTTTTFDNGSLIPRSHQPAPPPSPGTEWTKRITRGAKVVAPIAILTLLFTSVGYTALSQVGQTAAPIVVVEHPYTNETVPLQYGVELGLTERQLFTETRDAFIDASISFVSVDLADMRLQLFDEGVLLFSAPLTRKGEPGSWCETPAGLYEVSSVSKEHYSVVADAVLPHYITFANNYALHGPPRGGSDESVSACIELAAEDARHLGTLVERRMPVLVHEAKSIQDEFVYAPKVPELDTPHYLLADINNSTVLASTPLNEPAPIASITKLMTALIAIEEINLDRAISVTEEDLIQSLIPRLGNQTQVSVYSLLQLLLVESSNEAAEIIASAVGRERFIARMNERAAAIGMTNTTYADPSGLSNDNVSSLADLLRLTQYIYQNRSIIFALTADQDTPTTYTGGAFGELMNFNTVAGLDNFIGGKVGETRAAGQTSVTLHTLTIGGQERIMAIILLGSDSRSTDVTELLEYAKDRFGD